MNGTICKVFQLATEPLLLGGIVSADGAHGEKFTTVIGLGTLKTYQFGIEWQSHDGEQLIFVVGDRVTFDIGGGDFPFAETLQFIGDAPSFDEQQARVALGAYETDENNFESTWQWRQTR